MTKVLAAAKQLPMSPEQANVIFFFTPGIETWTSSLCVVQRGLSVFYVSDKRLLLHVYSPTGNIIHTFVVLALPFILCLPFFIWSTCDEQ